ncbi:Vacuolar protein 8 [Mortierella sp. AD094]|nr:Vacuolar protein 8 [Mortierella sp. AD094]
MVQAYPFEEEGILDAVSILANSNNVIFQVSAALSFGEVSLLDIWKIDFKTLKPLLHLLKSSSVHVQIMALSALSKFAEDDQNKNIITRSGALVPLLHLTQSENAEAQQAATATVRELAQLKDNWQMVIDAGTVPIMLSLLKSSEKEVRLSSIETLNQVGFDLKNFRKLDTTAAELIHSLVTLSNSDDIREKQQAAMAYIVIVKVEYFQDEVVQCGGLESLHGLLMLTDLSNLGIVHLSLICINEISDHAKYQARLVDGGFLDRLIELLACAEEKIQGLAESTLFRLTHNGELGRAAVADSNIVERIRLLVQDSPPHTQTFMAMIISTLIDSEMLRRRLIPLGVIDIFIHCSTSSGERARRYGVDALGKLLPALSDHQPFVKAWGAPVGGIHGCLLRLLEDSDETLRKRGLGMIVLMLQSKSMKLANVVKNAGKLKTALKRIAQMPKKATPSKPTWELSDLLDDRAFNVKAAKSALNMMEGGKP